MNLHFPSVAVNNFFFFLMLTTLPLDFIDSLKWLYILGSNTLIYWQVLPDLFHTLRTCEDGLKEFITRKLGTLVSIVRQVNSCQMKLRVLFPVVDFYDHLGSLIGSSSWETIAAY